MKLRSSVFSLLCVIPFVYSWVNQHTYSAQLLSRHARRCVYEKILDKTTCRGDGVRCYASSPADTELDVQQRVAAGVTARSKKKLSVTKKKVQEKKEKLKLEAATKQLVMYNQDFLPLDMYTMFNSSTMKALLNWKDEVTSFFVGLERQMESLRMGIQAKVERDIRITVGAGDYLKRNVFRGTVDFFSSVGETTTPLLQLPSRILDAGATRTQSKLTGNFGAATTKQRSKQLRKKKNKWGLGVGSGSGVDSLYRSVRVLPNTLQYDYQRRVKAREASALSRSIDISRSLPQQRSTGTSVAAAFDLDAPIAAVKSFGLPFIDDGDDEITDGDVATTQIQSRQEAVAYLMRLARKDSLVEIDRQLQLAMRLYADNAAVRLLLSKPDSGALFADFDALFAATAADTSTIASIRMSLSSHMKLIRKAGVACGRLQSTLFALMAGPANGSAQVQQLRLKRSDLGVIADGLEAVVASSDSLTQLQSQLRSRIDSLIANFGPDAEVNEADASSGSREQLDIAESLLTALEAAISSESMAAGNIRFEQVQQQQQQQQQNLHYARILRIAQDALKSQGTTSQAVVDLNDAIDIDEVEDVSASVLESQATVLDSVAEEVAVALVAEELKEVAVVTIDDVATTFAYEKVDSASIDYSYSSNNEANNALEQEADTDLMIHCQSSNDASVATTIFDTSQVVIDDSLPTYFYDNKEEQEAEVGEEEDDDGDEDGNDYIVLNEFQMELLSGRSDTSGYTTSDVSASSVVVDTTAMSVDSREEQLVTFVVTAFDVSLYLVETLFKAVGPALKTGGTLMLQRALATYYLDEVSRRITALKPLTAGTDSSDDFQRGSWGIYTQFINWRRKTEK